MNAGMFLMMWACAHVQEFRVVGCCTGLAANVNATCGVTISVQIAAAVLVALKRAAT